MIAAPAASVALAVAGCAAGSSEAPESAGETLTVYASLPAHGPAAAAARDAEAGMRVALSNAGHRAGGSRVRLVRLRSTTGGSERWDRATVAANARRAVRDPRAIAYVGELDSGGSSVSLPITTRAGLLQVSPADGLTTLGRNLSGDDIDRSRRYSPDRNPTFVRLVPPDLDGARRIAASLTERRVRRLAVLDGGGVADRELTTIVMDELVGDIPPPVVRLAVDGGGRRHAREIAARVAAARPDAILYAGSAGRAAGAVLAALAARLPAVPVIGGPPLASGGGIGRVPARACAWSGVPSPAQLPPRGRRLLADMRRQTGRELGTHAVLGHAAMRLTLNAIAKAGPSRRGVIRAARANVDWDEVAVGYGLGNRAHVEPVAVACVPLTSEATTAAERP